MSINTVSESTFFYYLRSTFDCAPDLVDLCINLILRINDIFKKFITFLVNCLCCCRSSNDNWHNCKSHLEREQRPLIIRQPQMSPELEAMYVGVDRSIQAHIERAQALGLSPPTFHTYKLDLSLFENPELMSALHNLLADYFCSQEIAQRLIRFTYFLISAEPLRRPPHGPNDPSGVITLRFGGYGPFVNSKELSKIVYLTVHLPELDLQILQAITEHILKDSPTISNDLLFYPTDWRRETPPKGEHAALYRGWTLPLVALWMKEPQFTPLESRHINSLRSPLEPGNPGDRGHFDKKVLDFLSSCVPTISTEERISLLESLWKFVTAFGVDCRKLFALRPFDAIPLEFSILPSESGTLFQFQTPFSIENEADFKILEYLIKHSFFKACFLEEKEKLQKHFLLPTPWEFVDGRGTFSLYLRHRITSADPRYFNRPNTSYVSIADQNQPHSHIITRFLDEAYQLRGIPRGPIDHFWVRVLNFEDYFEYALIDLRTADEINREGSTYFEREKKLVKVCPPGFTFYHFDPRSTLFGDIYEDNSDNNIERVRYRLR